ncbi:MAG: hypothetical protein LBL39_08440 [Planctomycetaceae bacterium]|nr:hypothetical protein [Planctomycetaceae bacterium]
MERLFNGEAYRLTGYGITISELLHYLVKLQNDDGKGFNIVLFRYAHISK